MRDKTTTKAVADSMEEDVEVATTTEEDAVDTVIEQGRVRVRAAGDIAIEIAHLPTMHHLVREGKSTIPRKETTPS